MQRGYLNEHSFRAASKVEQTASLVWLSNQLTYPLTVAHAWENLHIPDTDTIETPKLWVLVDASSTANECRYPYYWLDLSVLTNKSMDIEFIGPQVEQGYPEEVHRTPSHPYQRKRLGLVQRQRFTHAASMEDLWEGRRLSNKRSTPPDAFVAFHPSFEEQENGDGGEKFWKNAIQIIKESGKPLLVTSPEEDSSHKFAAMISNMHGGSIMKRDTQQEHSNKWGCFADPMGGGVGGSPTNGYVTIFHSS
jgi:hypothetical protein